MTPAKPLASVSLDVDNLWSYMKTHGDAGWEGRPSYLHAFIPTVLDVLDQLGLRITFFIVGVDADREENAEVFPALTRCGHEVGNHSYQHEPWLHLYSQEQLEGGNRQGGTGDPASDRPAPAWISRAKL
ncbi:MAG: polysaccharide deacetylase family protein [bacterium]